MSKIRRILRALHPRFGGELGPPIRRTLQCAENFVLLGPARYALLSMAPLRPGRPGIAKTRELPLIQRRVVELWQSNDYRWRELFAAADVMSEGATRKDVDGAVYYGSTSIVLTLGSRDAVYADKLVRALSKDPHVRLRAVRIACLEAQLRATGAIGRVHSEFRVKPHQGGACIDVDVHANVFSDLAHRPAKTKAPFVKLPKRKTPGTRR